MYKPRNLNPLGIRKLDVQAARRQSWKDAQAEASRMISFNGDRITPDNFEHWLKVAYSKGWEAGVTVGATATRERVAEALDKGTLVKP